MSNPHRRRLLDLVSPQPTRSPVVAKIEAFIQATFCRGWKNQSSRRILPPAVGMKAQDEGLALISKTREQLYNGATLTIKEARHALDVLMREQIIRTDAI